MSTHAEGLEFAREALEARFGADPSEGECIALSAISCLETSHGKGWKGAGRGSHNQGAIQCGSGWSGKRFSYIDTHPNPDGSSTQYRVDFRAYPTELAGWFDLAGVAFSGRRDSVRREAKQHNWLGVSQELRRTGYYEGFGKTQEERVQHHYRALTNAIARDGAGVVTRVVVDAVPPTVQFGCIGEAVRLLQMELRIAADGIFGRLTRIALRVYQREHGLTVDGICGPKTWAALFADDYIPKAA